MRNKIILLLIVLGCSAGLFLWSQQPSYTVFRTILAVTQKDQNSFLSRVDLDRVSVGFVEDFISLVLKDMGVDKMDASMAGALAIQFVEGFRKSGVDLVKTNIQNYFANKEQEGGDSRSGIFTAAVSFYFIQSSDFGLDWRWKTHKDTDFAMVEIGLTHKPTHRRIPVRVRLERQAGEWRIVRIYNLIESYIAFER